MPVSPDDPLSGAVSGSRRSFVALTIFTLLYMGSSVGLAFVRGNREFIFYIVVMAVLIVSVLAIHRIVRLRMATLWCLSVWGLLHMAGGLIEVPESWNTVEGSRVLYSWWLVPGFLKYDQVIHAYGFGVTTWACWQGMQRALLDRSGDKRGDAIRPTFGLMTLAATAGMGFGALNEVVEFFATLLIESTNVGGYVNTGWDLVSNTVGCTVAAIWIRVGSPRATPEA